MPRVSAQVILRTADNVPANFVTNTFYFDLDTDIGGGELENLTEDIGDALVALYQTLLSILAGIQLTGHRIKFVDIDGARPQYPYEERVFSISGTVQATSLPHEVCIVSSFEADRTPGLNQATRRGRVFLGPIGGTALQSDGRITDAARALVAGAFNAFFGKQDGAGFSGWLWVVYSRKNDSVAPVKMGHVDNEFDTQRRRGVASTMRSVWGV